MLPISGETNILAQITDDRASTTQASRQGAV